MPAIFSRADTRDVLSSYAVAFALRPGFRFPQNNDFTAYSSWTTFGLSVSAMKFAVGLESTNYGRPSFRQTFGDTATELLRFEYRVESSFMSAQGK